MSNESLQRELSAALAVLKDRFGYRVRIDRPDPLTAEIAAVEGRWKVSAAPDGRWDLFDLSSGVSTHEDAYSSAGKAVGTVASLLTTEAAAATARAQP